MAAPERPACRRPWWRRFHKKRLPIKEAKTAHPRVRSFSTNPNPSRHRAPGHTLTRYLVQRLRTPIAPRSPMTYAVDDNYYGGSSLIPERKMTARAHAHSNPPLPTRPPTYPPTTPPAPTPPTPPLRSHPTLRTQGPQGAYVQSRPRAAGAACAVRPAASAAMPWSPSNAGSSNSPAPVLERDDDGAPGTRSGRAQRARSWLLMQAGSTCMAC